MNAFQCTFTLTYTLICPTSRTSSVPISEPSRITASSSSSMSATMAMNSKQSAALQLLDYAHQSSVGGNRAVAAAAGTTSPWWYAVAAGATWQLGVSCPQSPLHSWNHVPEEHSHYCHICTCDCVACWILLVFMKKTCMQQTNDISDMHGCVVKNGAGKEWWRYL